VAMGKNRVHDKHHPTIFRQGTNELNFLSMFSEEIPVKGEYIIIVFRIFAQLCILHK
jgi:hypothetical protein